MSEHEKIDYLEFPASDLSAEKAFFGAIFGWSFVDHGPDYVAFSKAGVEGGFHRSALSAKTEGGSALVVFYSRDLEQTLTKIEKAGGSIIKPIFSFPGGRRFHFCDPCGNEFAVWSEEKSV